MSDAFASPAWWPPYDPNRPIQSRGPLVMGLDIALTTLAVFVVSGRFYSRSRITKSLKSDDWIILAALVLLITKTVSVCLLIETVGYGKHSYDVTPEEYMGLGSTSSLFANYFIIVGSVTETFLVRTSVLLFLGRINPYVWMRNCVWTGLAMNSTHYLISLCSTIFRCGNPKFSFSFDVAPPGVTCLDSTPWNLALNITAILLDFYCWSLPAWLVWRVPVPVKARLQLIGVLCFGLVACVGGSTRIAPAHGMYEPTSDISWVIAEIYISSNIEMSVGIIAACIPGNKPLFDILSRTVHGWYFAMSSQGSYGSKDRGAINESQAPVNNIALATIDRQDVEAQRNLEWDSSSMVNVTIDGQHDSEGKNSLKMMMGRIGRLDTF